VSVLAAFTVATFQIINKQNVCLFFVGESSPLICLIFLQV